MTPSTVTRRMAHPKGPSLAATLFLWVALLLAASAGVARAGITERVSVASDGTQGNDDSISSECRFCISADGRFVTFASVATNLAPGTNVARPFQQVFVRDRVTGTTELVSVSTGGTPGNGLSNGATISADGRFVAFRSDATNLVAGDTNGLPDVFVRDRVTGTTERVSVATGGTQGNGFSFGPSVSADGRFVAFESFATNLVTGDTNGFRDVFVRDRLNGTTERVSVATGGTQGNGDSFSSSISADGHYVAFSSAATNLVVGDTNVRSDVFVRDRVTGRTERVSVATGGTQGNGASDRPSISADGRFVAFDSNATNLVAGDTNGRLDVFVRDRVTGTTERLTQGNSDSFSASISADGRSVAFESSATNLVAGDTNGFRDVFVFDRVTGATELVSVATDGTQGNGQSDRPSISADGRFVAFGSSATNSSASSATNLVAGDTNSHSDVFVRDRLTTLSLPGLSISDAGGREGSEGTSPRSLFIVSLSAAMPVPVFVDFWVDNGTARAGSDFTPKFGTLTFNPGVTERSLTVTVSGDNVVEHDETFVVNLDVPVFAVIARGRGVGTILNDDLPFGTAELTPATATVAVHERLPYSVTWTVPPPLTWHDLDSVELRIRDDQGTILWVGFDEAAGTLGLLNAAGHRVGPAFPPGHRGQLESSGATLYLRDSRVEGSGPTGPSVTLTLEVSFKPRAAGRTYVVEVLAVDDAGQEQIEPAGTLTVTR